MARGPPDYWNRKHRKNKKYKELVDDNDPNIDDKISNLKPGQYKIKIIESDDNNDLDLDKEYKIHVVESVNINDGPNFNDIKPLKKKNQPKKVADDNDLNSIAQQIILLIIGALSFVVAFAINEGLKDFQGTWFKGKPIARIIYIVGVILIAGIIIYYLGTYID